MVVMTTQLAINPPGPLGCRDDGQKKVRSFIPVLPRPRKQWLTYALLAGLGSHVGSGLGRDKRPSRASTRVRNMRHRQARQRRRRRGVWLILSCWYSDTV